MQENLVIKKPWGNEYSVFKDGTSARVLHINKGEETSFHCHMKKDVLIILLKGRARLIRNGHTVDYMEDVEMQPMFVKQIPKTIFHKTIALEDSTIIEIESTDNVHDLIRGEDKYNRAQGYEVKNILCVDDIVQNL